MKKAIILYVIALGAAAFLLLAGCDAPGAAASAGPSVLSGPVGCPDCPDVSRVGDVTTPLNPEPENLFSRSVNLVNFNGRLYAMHLNLNAEVDRERWFQVYVSVHGCGDEWTRTNQGKALNINEKGIQYAANCDIRLIEYGGRLFAFWQETCGAGTVMYVKRYNADLDLWERVDENREAGLSSWFIGNPKIVEHWTYFYYASAVVYNNELYVAWGQILSGSGGMAMLRYDGSAWSVVNPVRMPGKETWGHGWLSLAVFENRLHLASVTKKNDEDKRGFLEVYRYEDASGQWTQISNHINSNIYDNPATTSLIECGGALYIAWREINNASSEYSALPHKIFVKAYRGGTAWEFAGSNPVVNNVAFNPILLAFKGKLTLVYGDNSWEAFVKQFDGTAWTPLAGTGRIARDIVWQGKFPQLAVFSAAATCDKIYFAWRKRTDADHYFCGYVDGTEAP